MGDVLFTANTAAINNLLTGADGPVAKLLLRRAIRGETAAKRTCPVRTGRLRSSITHRIGRDSKGLFVMFGTDVHYALDVEMGGRNRRAKPYLRPALDEAMREQ